ncbi:ribonuclease E/G [uncultured Hyphomonas sp.]|uniref:ribonuclease E/G n=1 Tax=uncultured Hyphomonas sp. TaxID=225298 RepID=UPI002AAC170A|nr:ribonuclease E/G [uncultured Hyphomonas sp.]
MPAARILQEVCAAETREVALDETGRPIAIRLTRLTEDRPVRIGQPVTGRLRATALSQGGGFVELDGGAGEAFLRLKEGHGLTEGQSLQLQVAAEPREGSKLARVALADKAADTRTQAPWGTAPVEQVEPGDQTVAMAFDLAVSDTVPLPGGGNISLERTRALVAVDVDTSGRTDTGRAASRALKVNLDAAAELARQIRLRNLGGMIVMDCVSPLNREAGKQVRDRFSTVFRAVSSQSVKALLPSELGLLQASVEWAETPLAERLLDTSGQKTPRTVCFDGLRRLEQEARAKRMDRLCLDLPRPAFDWLQQAGADLRQALAEKYGDRFTYDSTDPKHPLVFTAP